MVLAAAFCIVYVLVLGRWENRPSHARLGLAVIAAIAVLACAIYGSDWTSMWIYVSAATGFVIPGRRAAMLAVVAVAGGYLADVTDLARVGQQLLDRHAAGAPDRLGHDRLPDADSC